MIHNDNDDEDEDKDEDEDEDEDEDDDEDDNDDDNDDDDNNIEPLRCRLQSKTAVVNYIPKSQYKLNISFICCGLTLIIFSTERFLANGESETKIVVSIRDMKGTMLMPFHYSLELYPLPHNNNKIPLRNDENYLCEITETPEIVTFSHCNYFSWYYREIQNGLRDEYLSDPANGFADENGHYKLFVRFTVSLDGPVETESNYEMK